MFYEKLAALADLRAQYNAYMSDGNAMDRAGQYFQQASPQSATQHANMAAQALDTGVMQKPDAFGDSIKAIQDNSEAISEAAQPVIENKIRNLPMGIGNLLLKSSSDFSMSSFGNLAFPGAGALIDTAKGYKDQAVESQITEQTQQGAIQGVNTAVKNTLGLGPGGDIGKNVSSIIETGTVPPTASQAKTSEGNEWERILTDKTSKSLQTSIHNQLHTLPYLAKSSADMGQVQMAAQTVANEITPEKPAIKNLGGVIANTVVNKPFDDTVENKGNFAFKFLNNFSKNPLGTLEQGFGGIVDMMADYGSKLPNTPGGSNAGTV